MARATDAIFPISLWRDKAFQLKQVRRVLWLALFFVVQTTLLLGVFYHQWLGKLVAGNSPLLFASEELGLIDERIPSVGSAMGQWLLIMLAINAVLMLGLGLYILRRMANPQLALTRALNEIGDGHLNVRLRTGDKEEFNEVCEALNRALEKVQNHIDDARRQAAIIESLDQQPYPDEQAMRDALERCHASLAFFESAQAGEPNRPSANGAHH